MQQLVRNILKSTTQLDNWETSLDNFTQVFDVAAAGMFSVHEFESHSMNFVWSELLRDGLTEEDLGNLERGEDDADSTAYKFLVRMPAQKLYSEPQCFGLKSAKDLPPSRLRKATEELGIETRIGSVLNRTGPWFDGLFAHAKNDRQLSALLANKNADIILPIIANSVSLGRTLFALRNQFQAALSVLDNLGIGVLLIDRSGCVIEHNVEAKRIIDMDDGLKLTRDKRIKLSTSDKTAELYSMISAVNGLLHGDIKTMPNLLAGTKRSEDYDLLFSVIPISDHLGELEVGLKSAFVAVIDPNRENALSTDGLAILGALTNAEISIVDLMVQGFRLDEVANQRDVSMNTVKSQLQSISAKLRCKSQNDIIRMAAATRVPLKLD